jgi:transcriptional regulator with XRE-family HTH domain
MPNPLHDPNYAVFRSMLVRAREKCSLTQVEVANRLKKPQSYVSKYERGERRLDFVEFVALVDVLGVDVVQFLKEFSERHGR